MTMDKSPVLLEVGTVSLAGNRAVSVSSRALGLIGLLGAGLLVLGGLLL